MLELRAYSRYPAVVGSVVADNNTESPGAPGIPQMTGYEVESRKARGLGGEPSKDTKRRSSLWVSLVSHSHTITTSQPSCFKDDTAVVSRFRFEANLSAQNSLRVLGVVVRLHPSWRCQKQPWTKITFRRPRNTMSGRPGRSPA